MTIVSPSYIKQKARQLKKEKSLSQHQAYDEAARYFGFHNYKHYLNVLEDKQKQAASTKETLLKNIYSEKDISTKERFAISFIQDFKISIGELLDILKQFQDSAAAIQSVCEKSNLKDVVQTFLLNDFHTEEGSSELQNLPFNQYFIAKEISVKNLQYSLENDVLYIDGDYDLKLEFECEIPEEYKDLPHFYREPMFGDFEIKIDEDAKLTIMNSSIGEKIGDRIYAEIFR
ncbi:hypothetical protein CC99x_009835 [Candidatus Berkiella cookevillensis]|nr:hypothetical protein [Candidatus Berkiella cookevillensis]MCS5709204.1 hypothetical protein [Candidatus Berkiella cookevillensis]